MSSVVLDFFHNNGGGGVTTDPRYLVRLRVQDGQIVDLVGNEVINNNVTISNTGIIGSQCLSFDLNSYLTWPNGLSDTLDAENFTFSCWVDNITSYRTDWDIWNTFSSNIPNDYNSIKHIDFGIVTSTGLIGISYGIDNNNNWKQVTSSTETVVNNGKCHVALCRKNNTAYLFLNGTLVKHVDDFFNDLAVFDTNFIRYFPDPPYWINQGWAGMKGQIDDMCLIKGIALWTDNFTPPTTYLPDNLDRI